MESGHAPPGGGPTPPGTSRKRRSALLEFATRYWLAILGVAILAWLAASWLINVKYLNTDAWPCIRYAFALSPDFGSCENNLTEAINSVPRDMASSNRLFEPTVPAFLMWLDNLFVDAYTLFFITSAGLAYKKLTSVRSDPIVLWRAAITITCIFALLGALADHAENFWILAHMGSRDAPSGSVNGDLSFVARLSVAKFWFFAVNLVVNAIWWVRVGFLYRWEKERYELLESLLAEPTPHRLGELLGLPSKDMDVQWPDEIVLIVPRPGTQVWLGVFFYHFVTGHRNDATFRSSFSFHAIRRWQSKLPLDEPGPELAAKYNDELTRFLKVLSNNGYLTPKGARYEVTWSTFHSSASGQREN